MKSIKDLTKRKKETVNYAGLENGKLEMNLVADRPEELKEEEETITQQILEAEEKLTKLP